MKGHKAASRYAKSILDLAIEQSQVDVLYADMQLIASVCKNSNDLVLLLKSPVVKKDVKLNVLSKVFGSQVGTITNSFLSILTKKNREELLADIATSFIQQYKNYKNIVTAKVTTAIALNDALRAEITSIIKSSGITGTLELEESVDPTIIGGIILRVEDKQVDASLLRSFKDLKKKFSTNLYVNQLG